MKSILFDLDGTLTDSGEGIMKSVVYALSHYGIKAPTEAELRTAVGPPLTESFTRFGVPADQLEEAIKIYRSRYIPVGRFENYPYPGVRELLDSFRKTVINFMWQPPSPNGWQSKFWSILILQNTSYSSVVPLPTYPEIARKPLSPIF